MGHPPMNANEKFTLLKEDNLIEADEVLEVAERGDYYQKILCFYDQVRGAYFFSDKSVSFMCTLARSVSWSLRYADIKRIKKCSVGPFLPFGIKLFYYDEEKGKERSYKMSVLNRQEWIDLLQKKTGI